MRTVLFSSAVLLVFGILLAKPGGTPTGAGFGNHTGASPHRPELEYLQAVNSVGPPRDPQLLFLLMGEYSNANLQGEGAEFFSARLKEFGPRLRRPKGSVSERHRVIASPARIVSLVAASSRLRERYACDLRTGQASLRREDFRSELGRGDRPCGASRLFPSEECSRS